MDMRTPVKSSMSFVAPDAVVKASPSIKNLMNDPVPKAAPPVTVPSPSPTPAPVPEQPAAPVAVPVPEPIVSESLVTSQPSEPQPIKPEENPSPVTETTPTDPLPTSTPTETLAVEANPEISPEKFKEKWDEMVDNIFNKVPTLQAPLKNYPLELKNNIVYLKLRNSMQVDDFSIKKVAVLQYLRNHFDPNINDVEVELDDKTEVKKYILDEKDKIKELQHQNPDFAEFMQTLNLQSCN